MELTAAQRAVVADEHPLSLDSLERVVARLGIEVTGRTTQVGRVSHLVQEQRPDLLVLGVESLDTEVQQLLRMVRRVHPDSRIVVICDEDPRSAQTAFSAGAHAYCDRTASADDLAVAIRQSFERSIHLRPTLADATWPTGALVEPRLTRREVETLRLVAAGRTNSEIAEILWITVHTVKFHMSNIFRKLNVGNRADASRWAERHALLEARSGTATNRRR